MPPPCGEARPIGHLPNVFTNQHLINAFFLLAGELGVKGDDLMRNAGLNVLQLAADEPTRQLRYSGAAVDDLPGLNEDRRARIKANLVRELRNVKPWSGVIDAPAGLNLRAQPNGQATVLLTLSDQSAVDALIDDDPQSEWVLVATSDGAAGFVARRFVQRADLQMSAIPSQPLLAVAPPPPVEAAQPEALPVP